jgi:hypothetical protein
MTITAFDDQRRTRKSLDASLKHRHSRATLHSEKGLFAVEARNIPPANKVKQTDGFIGWCVLKHVHLHFSHVERRIYEKHS